VTGTANFFVMKTTPTREQAAMKFLEYVLSEKFQTEWSIATGFFPVTFSAAQSKAYQEFISKNPLLKMFLDQVSVAYSQPGIAGYSRVSESLGRAIEATLLGEPAQKALISAQKRLELIWDNDKN